MVIGLGLSLPETTRIKGKGKVTRPRRNIGEVLISLSEDVEPVSGKTIVSVTHGQCDARPTTLIYTAC